MKSIVDMSPLTLYIYISSTIPISTAKALIFIFQGCQLPRHFVGWLGVLLGYTMVEFSW
jgi:hypothetical protein